MSKQIFQKFDVEFRKKVIVPTPEGDDEAVNKAYADNLVSVSDYRVRGEDVISGMPIATASLLELSFLDLYSNKYVIPNNANVGNRMCVKMAGAEFGYTNGVIDVEDLPTADKVEINDNLGNGICVAVLIFDESNGTVEPTQVLSPYGIYLHMANNPGVRVIRIGNFFRNAGKLFFDVNPGII